MNKALKLELDQALQDVGNTAVPMTDDQVRDLIHRLRGLQRLLVEWRAKNSPRK